MNSVLWQPSAEQQENANISRFMQWVGADYGVEVTDYAALYQWSIENPAAFWSLMWDFAGIKATRKGEVILTHENSMPGALWFPDARLNYAENLLRQPEKSNIAIIFRGENGETRRISYQRPLLPEFPSLLRLCEMTVSSQVIAWPAFYPTFPKPSSRCWQPPALVRSGVAVHRISEFPVS